MSAILRWTIILSVLAHGVIYVLMVFLWKVPLASKKGIVSISFVESVSHAPEPLTASSNKRRSLKPAAPPTLTPAPATVAPNEVSPPSATDPREVNYFISAVKRLIDHHKIFPKEAVDRGEEGKVTIGLTLDRDGRLLNSTIEIPCPFDLINRAALKTVLAVPQFPPVPASVGAPIHLHVPLVFRIEEL